MSVPDVAVAGALLERESTRMNCRHAVASEAVLAALVYSVRLVAVTVAVLAIGPVAAGLICTTIVKVWVASAASVPSLQLPLPAGFTLFPYTTLFRSWTGSTSVTVPPLEVEGPLLVTVRE